MLCCECLSMSLIVFPRQVFISRGELCYGLGLTIMYLNLLRLVLISDFSLYYNLEVHLYTVVALLSKDTWAPPVS